MLSQFITVVKIHLLTSHFKMLYMIFFSKDIRSNDKNPGNPEAVNNSLVNELNNGCLKLGTEGEKKYVRLQL